MKDKIIEILSKHTQFDYEKDEIYISMNAFTEIEALEWPVEKERVDTVVSDSTRLLPCPFCGGEARLMLMTEPHTHSEVANFMPDVIGYTQFIECSQCVCALHGGEFNTSNEAIKSAITAWNTRAKLEHKWVKHEDYSYCKQCGNVKRADGKNSPCKGKVKIEPRELQPFDFDKWLVDPKRTGLLRALRDIDIEIMKHAVKACKKHYESQLDRIVDVNKMVDINKKEK